MVIALVGVIVIQVMWINNAADKRKEVLSYQMHDALNQVNQSITQKENLAFIEARFGGLDSLYEEVLIEELPAIDSNVEKEHQVVVIENRDSNQNVRIEYHNSFQEDGLNEKVISLEKLQHKLQIKIENELKTVARWEGRVNEKVEEVNHLVQHFAFEKMTSGALRDRLMKKEVEQKLKEALQEQGIAPRFDWSVYNTRDQHYEKGYRSSGFDSTLNSYSVMLFPKDQIGKDQYELQVQLQDEDQFVWQGIQNMAYLSIGFTLLIILCFAYALHFIFKQKRISKVKSDLINNMSHELKTPLASIALASASIRHPEVIQNSEEVQRMLSLIDDERHKMNTHIEKVLDMAAAEQGKFKIHAETVSLNMLLQECIKNVSQALEGKKGEIEVVLDGDITIEADPFHMKNAITNILDNSIKYCDQSPQIEVRGTVANESLILKISDNGIGMSTKSQKMAFAPFYRAETGDIHNRKGFGLGLSYVKEVIVAHKGEISLESKQQKGTIITIKIPVHGG